MSAPSELPYLPHDRALRHCADYIAWYERVKGNSRRLDYLLQTATIGFSAATPLLLLIDSLPAAIKALPATVATIAAGLQGVFKFRERYLGFAMASELLKAEKLRFELTVAGLAHGESGYLPKVERFAARINRIVLAETGEWRRHLSMHSDRGEQPAPDGS